MFCQNNNICYHISTKYFELLKLVCLPMKNSQLAFVQAQIDFEPCTDVCTLNLGYIHMYLCIFGKIDQPLADFYRNLLTIPKGNYV